MKIQSNFSAGLIYTCLLTDASLNPVGFYGKNFINTGVKVNQFLSSLHSLENLNLSNPKFYLSYDENYSAFEGLVRARIYQIFPTAKIYSGRLESRAEWLEMSKECAEQNSHILLMSNHDHAYIQESPGHFLDLLTEMKNNPEIKFASITHWPEMIHLKGLQIKASGNGEFLSFQDTSLIGTTLVRTDFMHSWWEDDFTLGKRIVRPDNPFGPSVKFPNAKAVLPVLELFRHLDGYEHVGIKTANSQSLSGCCKVWNGTILHNEIERKFLSFSLKSSNCLPLGIPYKQKIDFLQITDLISASIAYRVRWRNVRLLLNAHRINLLWKILIISLQFLRFSFHKQRTITNIDKTKRLFHLLHLAHK